MRRAHSLAIILILAVSVPAAVVVAIAAGPAAPGPGVPAVWFSPAEASPDLPELFTRPEAWAKARSQIGVFLFSPTNVDTPRPGQANPLTDLIKVDAFRKLKEWGIRTAIEAPGIKEWDCDGRKSIEITERFIRNVVEAGGTVATLSLDEPLVSALGHNKPLCHLSFEEAGRIMARYQASLRASPAVAAQRQMPELFEDEAYPSFSIAQLEDWLRTAAAQGYRPAGLTLDVDLNAVEISPQAHARLAPDLREMQRFLKEAGIAFGIILWSGHDPLRSDREYYDDVMDWARQVHAAIGRPDYVLFESWVTRCSLRGPCTTDWSTCSTVDPPYCGRKSIPLNLPETGANSFSHARLLMDAFRVYE